MFWRGCSNLSWSLIWPEMNFSTRKNVCGCLATTLGLNRHPIPLGGRPYNPRELLCRVVENVRGRRLGSVSLNAGFLQKRLRAALRRGSPGPPSATPAQDEVSFLPASNVTILKACK